MSIPLNLSCWYLNTRRIGELVGVENLLPHRSQLEGRPEHIQKLIYQKVQKDAVVAWMNNCRPPSLEKMIIEGDLAVGEVFTHHSNFFFKGLSKVLAASQSGKSSGMAEGYSKIDHWRPKGRVSFPFHPEHLTSTSSGVQLAGQKRMMVLGLITDIDDVEIKSVPYVIANIANTDFMAQDYFPHWRNYLEIHVDQIDNFALVKDYSDRLTKSSLIKLKDIPERDVKAAFAEIINEPQIPKDWGGESSDLFSSYVRVDGERKSTAFALKGPSKFRPMTTAALGKNGDQISRLFDDPADLYVLQHCHEIVNDVRKIMRAFANQFGKQSLFCVIDGYDTIRILETYEKCGLGPASHMRQDGSNANDNNKV